MTWNMDTAFVTEFHATFDLLDQQLGSAILNAGAVLTDTQVGEFGFYDQIEPLTDHTTNPARGATTAYSDPAFARRRTTINMEAVAIPLENFDVARMLSDPSNQLMKTMVYDFGRVKDEYIITAASGTAYTGKDGTTTVDFDETNTISGSGSDWSGSTTTFNLEKLLGIRSVMNGNDIPRDGRYVIAHPDQSDYLLTESELTSSDYNSVRSLVVGDVNTFLGLNFVWTTVADSAVAFAWHKSAMLFTTGTGAVGPKVRVQENMLYNYRTELYTSMHIGATRLKEAAVVKILCPTS